MTDVGITDTGVSRRPYSGYTEGIGQRTDLRDEKKVRTPQRYPAAVAEPYFWQLALTLVRLWLLCWYPEGFLIKSRRK